MIDQFRVCLLIRLAFLVAVALPLIFSSAASTGDSRYVVKKNDTLTEIARKNGVTVAVLMDHNGLDHPNKIYQGMVLRIPSKSEKSDRTPVEGSLQKKLNQIHVTPKKWKYIVIHHSATESGTVAGMDRYHREERHMENGLAYHFVIGNGHGMGDGEVSIGHRWTEQLDGGHLASETLNAKSIGICLVGNFDQDRPTEKQLASLKSLLNYLMKQCRLTSTAVKTHQQINPIFTRCPGRQFPAATFIRSLGPSKPQDRRARGHLEELNHAS